jgi:hypothetical protein
LCLCAFCGSSLCALFFFGKEAAATQLKDFGDLVFYKEFAPAELLLAFFFPLTEWKNPSALNTNN